MAEAASPSAQPVRVAGVEDARREALGELVLPPPDSRGGSPHALDMSFDVREETTPATFDGMERIRVREAYREREAGEGDTFFSPLDTDAGASAGAGRPSVGTATGAPAGGDDVGEVPVSPASSRDSYASPCEELEDAGRGRARTTSMQEDIRRLSGMEALCTPIASAASEGGASRAASPPPAVLLSRSPVRSPCAAPVVAGGAGSRGSEAVPDTILDFVNLDAADTLNVEAMASPSDAAAMARALQAEKKHGAALPSTLPEASLPKGAFGVPLEQHSMHAAALGAPPAVAAVLEATLATGVGSTRRTQQRAWMRLCARARP
ncbi:hypothetical protein EON68_03510 [archaeon]|nr:MAG: hypothetical protein EON68_03510 [archaeon]